MAKRVTLYSPAGRKYPDLPPGEAAQLRAYGYSERKPTAKKKPSAKASTKTPDESTSGGSDGS